MVKVLQINLRSIGSAYNLALQTARELEADIIVISEPARGPPDDKRCITSEDGSCKVMLSSRADMAITGLSRGRGFVSMSTGEVTIYSYYFSPNVTLEEYARLLNGLESDVRIR